VGIALFCLTIGMQFSVGAYRSERGSYSDEAAHLLNGVLIREYVYSGMSTNPVAFAKDYYYHYPKIAPLMWPPMFDAVLGTSLVASGGPPDTVALVLLAVFCAWTAWRLFQMASHLVGPVPAAVMAALFPVLPAVVALTSAVMLDVVIASIAIEAAYWLARFFQSGRTRDASIYGALTAACCLVKGNGIALVLMPFLMLVLTGRYDLLRRAGLYVAAAVVVIFAAPILAVSYRFDSQLGDFGTVSTAAVLSRMRYYGLSLWSELGPALTIAAVLGLGVSVFDRTSPRSDDSLPAAKAFSALVLAAIVFHILNPHKDVAGRYLALAFAPMLGLVPLALKTGVRWTRRLRWSLPVQVSALALVVLPTAGLVGGRTIDRAPLGFREAMEFLQHKDWLAGRRVLVISNETGEGAFVAAAAVQRIAPAPTVIRGSKLLASDDWMGRDPVVRYQSPGAMMQALADFHIDFVVVDSSPQASSLPYSSLVRALVASTEPSDGLERVFTNQVDPNHGPTRPVIIYRVTRRSAGPPQELQVDLTQYGIKN
jgi:hypothetical protein